jgi:hypothetical protein
MSDDRIEQALRALAEQDSTCEAPPRVEIRLLEAVRRRRRMKMAWRAGVAAAVVIGIAAAGAHWAAAPRLRPSPPLAELPVAVPAVPTSVIAQAQTPRRVVARRRTPRSVAVQAPAKEILTEFFPLMDAPPPFERGELVRVVLPASALRVVGLPVREGHLADPVQADVLIGEEGMARAIRFVSFE